MQEHDEIRPADAMEIGYRVVDMATKLKRMNDVAGRYGAYNWKIRIDQDWYEIKVSKTDAPK